MLVVIGCALRMGACLRGPLPQQPCVDCNCQCHRRTVHNAARNVTGVLWYSDNVLGYTGTMQAVPFPCVAAQVVVYYGVYHY